LKLYLNIFINHAFNNAFYHAFYHAFYQALPKAPPPKTELAAIGSPNPSLPPGVAAPTNGVVSCLYIAS
jgi:hypothetical protein